MWKSREISTVCCSRLIFRSPTTSHYGEVERRPVSCRNGYIELYMNRYFWLCQIRFGPWAIHTFWLNCGKKCPNFAGKFPLRATLPWLLKIWHEGDLPLNELSRRTMDCQPNWKLYDISYCFGAKLYTYTVFILHVVFILKTLAMALWL